jgi:hypothetical protein
MESFIGLQDRLHIACPVPVLGGSDFAEVNFMPVQLACDFALATFKLGGLGYQPLDLGLVGAKAPIRAYRDALGMGSSALQLWPVTSDRLALARGDRTGLGPL